MQVLGTANHIKGAKKMPEKRKEQICWSCANCTNGNLCSWVKSKKLPQGATLDKNNFINYCPQYEHDGLTQTKSKRQLANELGISYFTYMHNLKLERHYKLLLYYYKKIGVTALSKLLGIKATRLTEYKNKKYKTPVEVYRKLKQKYKSEVKKI